MNGMVNPALVRFLQAWEREVRVAQVLIRRAGAVFSLRHAEDAGRADEALCPLAIADLRALSQNTADGAFRPLHAAPDLRGGWRCEAGGPEELEAALDHLYPGFLADWLEVQSGPPPVTHYREFTARQTGMFRLTAKLSDALAADTTRACCHPRFCLKRRLWTAPGLPADEPQEKSIVPCLEPCPVLLEFARKRMRIFQETAAAGPLTPSDLRTLLTAVETALAHPPPGRRAADFAAPENPRHLEFLRRKIAALLPPESPAAGESGEE